MADVKDGGGCRECRGTGRVMLLVSSAPCTACGGTGRAAVDDAGPAADEKPQAPASASVAHARSYAACGDGGQAGSVTETAYDAAGRLLWRRQQLPAAVSGGVACCLDEEDGTGTQLVPRTERDGKRGPGSY